MFQHMFQVFVIFHVKTHFSNFASNSVKISCYKIFQLTDRFYNINHNMGRWIGGLSYSGPDGFYCSNWISKVPQGFSCGVGVAGPDGYEEFETVDCSEVIVKVVKAAYCDDKRDLGEDCFNFVNWGWLINDRLDFSLRSVDTSFNFYLVL